MAAKHLIGLLVFSLVLGNAWAQEEEQKSEEKAPSGTAASAPATPQAVHDYKISPEDAARKNPTKFTAVSVERGKKIFKTQCAMCHGEKGDGKGDMVEELKISPPDFTKPETLKNRTDGELFAIMNVGSGVMPDQRRMTEAHKWNIVNFLRSLSGKTPEKTSGTESEENVILVPQ
jgi:cytochrome c